MVRNGCLSEREIQTGSGPVRQPRVRDYRDAAEDRFTSQLLLREVSTVGFSDALQALLGADAPGLSSSTIVRLKKVWEEDYEAWSRGSLAGKRYVYLWVDGIHFFSHDDWQFPFGNRNTQFQLPNASARRPR